MQLTLKALRINAGLTQAEGAKKIGVSETTLHKYEAGKTFPDVPVIKAIEEAYGVKYADILFFILLIRFKCKYIR